MQKYVRSVGIKLQSPLKRLETGLKGGIMNMTDVERKEAGKESARLGLGALFTC